MPFQSFEIGKTNYRSHKKNIISEGMVKGQIYPYKIIQSSLDTFFFNKMFQNYAYKIVKSFYQKKIVKSSLDTFKKKVVQNHPYKIIKSSVSTFLKRCFKTTFNILKKGSKVLALI